jgi:CBS domain-containing protein
VCLAGVRSIDRERRAGMRVGEVMPPLELHALSPSYQASDALDRLTQCSVNQLPVVEEGRLLGMVAREDVLKWLSLSRVSANREEPSGGG